MRTHALKLLVLPLLILSWNCSTARVGRFIQFAEVGTAYTEAVEAFIEDAGAAAVDTDSLVLIKARDGLPKEERGKEILKHNDLLRERLALLSDIRRHTGLLKSYFSALASLAGSESPGNLGTSMENLVGSMGKVSQKIKEAKVGEYAVAQFSGSVTNLAVSHFKKALLEKELKKRAAIIERELDLQQAAMQAIAEQMRTDLKAAGKWYETRLVVFPFADTGSLPGSWMKQRREILTAGLSMTSADAAVQAAKKLKANFSALVENRLNLAQLQSLLGDIDRVLVLLEKIKGQEE